MFKWLRSNWKKTLGIAIVAIFLTVFLILEIFSRGAAAIFNQAMAEQDIDAFYLAIDLINDPTLLKDMLKPFYRKNIPVYLMEDVEAVRNGALMLISASDMINVGRFIADAVAKVLNGAEAGSLPCIYFSAPGIYLNYDVARMINYPLNFEFLSICDSIFVEES